MKQLQLQSSYKVNLTAEATRPNLKTALPLHVSCSGQTSGDRNLLCMDLISKAEEKLEDMSQQRHAIHETSAVHVVDRGVTIPE